MTGMTKAQEDALGLNKCLFCDDNDTTTMESGSQGVRIGFRVCRNHYAAASNVLVNVLGHSSSHDIWRSTECAHENMVEDVTDEFGGGWSAHGYICADCGFQTSRTEICEPNDPEITARLQSIFGRWSEDTQ